jgi:hypothetical protein
VRAAFRVGDPRRVRESDGVAALNKPTWRTEPMYDCKALGPLAPSVNKNGPLEK